MSDGSDTETTDGGDFEDLDSSSEQESETQRRDRWKYPLQALRDHPDDDISHSRSSSRQSGSEFVPYEPPAPFASPSTPWNGWVDPKIAHWADIPAQSAVLSTISQDLTQGKQHKRDQDLGSLASKIGRLAPDTSTRRVEITARRRAQNRRAGEQMRERRTQQEHQARQAERERELQERVSTEQLPVPKSSTLPATYFREHRLSGMPEAVDSNLLMREQAKAMPAYPHINAWMTKDAPPRTLDNVNEEPLTADGSTHDKSADKICEGDARNIDWRTQICSTLGIDQRTSDADILVALQQDRQMRPNRSPLGPQFKILHEVNCKNDKSRLVYEDLPYVANPESRKNHLRGRKMMSNYDLFVERHPGLSFIVYRQFDCCQKGVEKKPCREAEPIQSTDSISLISKTLISVLRKAAKASKRGELYPEFNHRKRIEAPYLWFFHDSKHLLQYFISDGGAKYRSHLHCFFQEYIYKHMVKEYGEVSSMLSNGMISEKYISYLFTPGCVILQHDEKKTNLHDRAFLQQFWPSKFVVSKLDGDKDSREQMERISSEFTGLFWEFDGKFRCYKRQITFQYDMVKGREFRIQSLPIFPLCFADEKDLPRLEARGRSLWECRNKKLVSYNGWDFSQIDHFKDTRIMVDMQTYNKLHKVESSHQAHGELIEELDSDAMKRDRPPKEEKFYLLMPPNTFGFVMRVRKWHNIMIENMSEVQWEEKAFDSLVMEPSTKELIQALVTSEIEESKTTDLMSGKGNGLIMLLHGGPGTGKTLTAESVAEYTRKPLYRITSGDIGTNPEAVEKYLDVVLDLGKQWDCVVLLDEAEVFLQTRSLTDLARNALVSVFLRVLEYFQGILILTSNRVATFDEAFKSRIQLALHYEPLGKKERKQVWQNFITRLETLDGENVDAADLKENVDRLAEVNMNGRQIRNAITTARQLAMFKSKTTKTRVDYKTLEYIIGVSQKFDSYLIQVNDGWTDERIARDEGVR